MQNVIEKSSTVIYNMSQISHKDNNVVQATSLQVNATQNIADDKPALNSEIMSSSPKTNEISVTISSPPLITITKNYRISEILSTSDSNGLHKITNGNSSSGNYYTEEVKYSSYDLKTEELELKIHYLINQERVKAGLPILSNNEDLTFIARNHSYDMATRNYFDHNTPEGITPEQRGIHIGYTTCGTSDAINLSEQFDYDKKLFASTGNTDQKLYNKIQEEFQQLQTIHLYFVGENIFRNNLYNSYETTNGIISSYDWNSPEEIASSTVQGWMNSPGHRHNILTDWHTEGIGVELSPDNKVYVTEDFC